MSFRRTALGVKRRGEENFLLSGLCFDCGREKTLDVMHSPLRMSYKVSHLHPHTGPFSRFEMT
jgi:hypothetical protein